MRLFRLAVQCPKCGRAPNRRVFPAAVAKHWDDPPDTPIETHRCSGCGEVYLITARAYQEATHENLDRVNMTR